jgi:hypothetical protein
MFSDATAIVRESFYGVWGRTTIGALVYHTPSSGFMVALGFLMTNAYSVHLDGDVKKPVHKELDGIRAPTSGSRQRPPRSSARMWRGTSLYSASRTHDPTDASH